MIKLSHILHPTDFSDASKQAQNYACALADHFGATLHFIHVVTDPTTVSTGPLGGYLPANYTQELKDHAEKTLSEYPAKEWSGKTPVERTVLEGYPFVEILGYAKENNIDMIVMGTHGHTGLAQMLLGSVAEKIVRKAPCPVLTVHPEDHKFVMP